MFIFSMCTNISTTILVRPFVFTLLSASVNALVCIRVNVLGSIDINLRADTAIAAILILRMKWFNIDNNGSWGHHSYKCTDYLALICLFLLVLILIVVLAFALVTTIVFISSLLLRVVSL